MSVQDKKILNDNIFTTIIVITPKDFPRLVKHYKRLVDCIPSDRLLFISGEGIETELKKASLGDGVSFVHEDELLRFDDVKECMTEHLRTLLGQEPVPRGAIGWYYQQFLKMEYAKVCEDEYYMVWDGDTIPCAPFSMFQEETGKPYLDLKQEYHSLYFETLEKLIPGMKKAIGKSFISEHMLFSKDIMKELIAKIEMNDAIPGLKYWEKVIHAIRPEQICDSGFSEFETYGTFVAFTAPDRYKLREWHSFRLAGEFFDPDTICDRDFEWLSKDFQAISFEKNQFVREDNKNLFDNPEYQKKLSARKMLEIAQEEFRGGYIEVWGDTKGAVGSDPLAGSNKEYRPDNTEDVFLASLGEKRLAAGNVNQAYLCYEQAEFLSDVCDRKSAYKEKMRYISQLSEFSLRKVSICIVSYNSRQLMEECIRSIKFTCAPDSYEIVVTDNASTDTVRDYLLSISDDLMLVLSDENLGFPAGCNCCIQYSKKENDIFLLNNDTRMTHNALFWLRYGLYETDEVGAAGCIGSYAGNDQMVRLPSEKVTDVVEYAVKNNVYLDNPYEEKSRLCGFAMIIKRPVLEKTGYLDEAFSPGYFEDDDLSLRINEAGYRMLVVHNSFIYHKGSEGFGKKTDTTYDIILRNYEYSLKKNGYDNFAAALIIEPEYKVIDRIISDGKTDFSLLEINCGSGNFLSHIKFLFPASYVCGTSARLPEVKHSVKSIEIIHHIPASDDLNTGGVKFDYVLVRIMKYDAGGVDTPGFISHDDARAKYSSLLLEGGSFLYLEDEEE